MTKTNLLILIVTFNLAISIHAKDAKLALPQDYHQKVEIILEELRNDNWIERAQALDQITNVELQDKRIKDFLIRLLEKEIEFKRLNYESKDFPWERWGEWYWKNLVELVAAIKEERVMSVLVETLDWTYSKKVGESLGQMGEPAVKYLLDALNDGKRRTGASLYIKAIIGRDNQYKETITDSTRELIKHHMLVFLRSRKPFIRITGIKVLGEFRGPEVIGLLREISETDPYFYTKKINGVEKKIYPIREEAKKQLKLMENR